MFNKVRNELMKDDAKPLKGDVEIDETSGGGKPCHKLRTLREQAEWREAKTTVLGMIERGGRIKLCVIASRRGEPLSGAVLANIHPHSIIFMDDRRPYRPLAREYAGHRVINHSAGPYVEGDIYTNTIEGFFGNLRTGMRGTYKKVSRKWLQSNLDEYAWRYNQRRKPHGMFFALLDNAARTGR